MEEIAFFLREYEVEATVQVVFENERLEEDSFFLKAKYGSFLKSCDPPHWMDRKADSTGVLSLESYAVPKNYTVVYPFTFSVSDPRAEHDQQTDKSGWRYGTSFYGCQWQAAASRSYCVRQRKWERLVVNAGQYDKCMLTLPIYYNELSRFRALSGLVIKASIASKHFPYKVQYVVENQRLKNGIFSGEHLDPSNDPPEWSMGASQDLADDPRKCNISTIRAYDSSIFFDRTQGFDLLHEFRYELYPEKDAYGWEYNDDFFVQNDVNEWGRSPTGVSKTSGDESCVRRRVWFRTAVSDNDLSVCRNALSSHLAAHPRELEECTFLLLNSLQTKWHPVIASLYGSKLFILDSVKKHSLMEFNLTEHVIISLTTIAGKKRGFGFRLKQHKEVNSYQAIFCSADEDRNPTSDWYSQIEYQMCQTDLTRTLKNGPPAYDEVVLASDMWLRKESFPYGWKPRTFELHRSGYLKVYSGTLLSCQFDVVRCTYALLSNHDVPRDNGSQDVPRKPSSFCGDGSQFQFSMQLRDQETVVDVRAMTKSVMLKWLEKLKDFRGEVSKSSYGTFSANNSTASAHIPSISQVYPEEELSGLMYSHHDSK